MDLSKWIRSKRNELVNLKPDSQIDTVLRHLDVAEKHFENGLSDRGHYFTDVVYRTNQVFEGILKELYESISGGSAKKKTPFQIENYLEERKLFNARVLKYFTNYRTDWRNPSTHDHKLDFSEHESFAAITTVSTFCYVSIDQMIYSLAESSVAIGNTQTELDPYSVELFGNTLSDKLTSVLGSAFSDASEVGAVFSSSSIVGLIAGAIRSLYKGVEISSDEEINVNGYSYFPDLFIKGSVRNVVIEVKMLPNIGLEEQIQNSVTQIQSLMEHAKTDMGVLIAIPMESDTHIPLKFKSSIVQKAGSVVVTIAP